MFRYAPLLGRSPEWELGEHRRRRMLERFAAGNASLLGKIIWFLGGRSPFPEVHEVDVPKVAKGHDPRSWTKSSVPPIHKNWPPAAGQSPAFQQSQGGLLKHLYPLNHFLQLLSQRLFSIGFAVDQADLGGAYAGTFYKIE